MQYNADFKERDHQTNQTAFYTSEGTVPDNEEKIKSFLDNVEKIKYLCNTITNNLK